MTDDFELEFDDFDSPDLDDRWGDDEGNDYIGGMWGQYGFGQSKTQDLITAHQMVQGFVNAFARDGYYRVTFDPNVRTAGTDSDAKRIVITPAPVLDTKITPQEAGLILTGMAVHEISHPRYGKDTSWAIKRQFPGSFTARKLGNLLDDVRIERRFVGDYPGYAGVFVPTLAYVAGSDHTAPPLSDPLNVAIAAIRYDLWTDWTPAHLAERAWWQDWARRWQREDAPARVVAAVREALRHVVEQKEEQKKQETLQVKTETSPQLDSSAPTVEAEEDDEADQEAQSQGATDEDATDDDQSQEDGSSAPQESAGERSEDEISDDEGRAEEAGAESDEDGDEESTAEAAGDGEPEDANDDQSVADGMSDTELGNAADEGQEEGDVTAICIGAEEVDDAAKEDGVSQNDIQNMKAQADQQIRLAEELEDGVDVARSHRGLTRRRYSQGVRKSPVAARYIADALMRSRTGHTDVARYQKRGRLDSHGLHRVASRDFRVFDRKHAPSPDRIMAWVLIDVSSSMGYHAAEAASVATAIADASRNVPSMRMQVWGWSYSFRQRYGFPGAARVWKTGDPTENIAKVADLPQGGTPDGRILNWAYKAILREVRTGEKPVIFLASDGFGEGGLKDVIDRARKAGVEVVSVALGYAVDEDTQRDRFGDGKYVAWQGTIEKTARPLAAMIAKLVARR